MQYTILLDNQINSLETEVNKYIKEGWKPQGGVAYQWTMAETNSYTTVLQAMIKED